MLKVRYKIRNWPEYNKALINRGNFTFWFSEEMIKNWHHDQSLPKKQGRNFTYSSICIECALTVRELLKFPLRSTQGFMNSMLELLGFPLKSPDYTTFCKRARHLKIEPFRRTNNKNLHILVDSTGLKVFGEGEWKTKIHGKSKRRTWRKLHIGIDANNQEIVISSLTENSVSDDHAFVDLAKQLPEKIESVSGDGAYDTIACYTAILDRQGKPIIPPQKNAVISSDPILKNRDNAINLIHSYDDMDTGRKAWKIKTNYHKRSLVETQMFRIKKIFGNSLKSINFTNQIVETQIKCKLLNLITVIGMPLSHRVFIG